MKKPWRLNPVPKEKVWGSSLTEPWFDNPGGSRIGEIWFEASASVPLLLKFLFTSDNLSIQVHPDDEYARAHENSRGKTEMWHVLRAEPGACVGIGLREETTAERLRAAALNGEIEELVNWIPAREGDTFFLPAGTIHGIGGGLTLCEVQELSDVTYRLYDYGRPRELHLDRGIEVSHLTRCEGRAARVNLERDRELLVKCDYFRTERLRIEGSRNFEPRSVNTLLAVLEGSGTIAGESFRSGDVWEVPAGAAPFVIEGDTAVFLVTSEVADVQ